MTATRPTKPTPAPSDKWTGRERTVPARDGAHERKREALERFVEKNARVLAELAK